MADGSVPPESRDAQEIEAQLSAVCRERDWLAARVEALEADEASRQRRARGALGWLSRLSVWLVVGPGVERAVRAWLVARRDGDGSVPIDETTAVAGAVARRVLRVGVIGFLLVSAPLLYELWTLTVSNQIARDTNGLMVEQNELITRQNESLITQLELTREQVTEARIQNDKVGLQIDEARRESQAARRAELIDRLYEHALCIDDRLEPPQEVRCARAPAHVRREALIDLLAMTDRDGWLSPRRLSTAMLAGSMPWGHPDPAVMQVTRHQLYMSGAVNWRIRQALPGVVLDGVDLRGLQLHGLDLRGASLRGANLVGVDLHDSVLSDADVRRARLWHADLRGVDLTNTMLNQADLSHADLRGAHLQVTHVDDADLSSVDFRGADFDVLHASSATWRDVICPDATTSSNGPCQNEGLMHVAETAVRVATPLVLPVLGRFVR